MVLRAVVGPTYLNMLLRDQHIDILCLQETWLLDRNIDKLNNMHPAYQTFGKSGGDAAERILPGRPRRGVSIAWRQSLSHNIRVIDINNIRICAVRFQLNAAKFILIIYICHVICIAILISILNMYSALTVLR